jgi:hypothetical protein
VTILTMSQPAPVTLPGNDDLECSEEVSPEVLGIAIDLFEQELLAESPEARRRFQEGTRGPGVVSQEDGSLRTDPPRVSLSVSEFRREVREIFPGLSSSEKHRFYQQAADLLQAPGHPKSVDAVKQLGVDPTWD